MLEFDFIAFQNKTKYHFKNSFESGKIHSILGESGSGKSTFLNILAGITPIDEGFIKYKDKIIFDSDNKINQAIYDRKISFVYQSLNLFPNLNVEENISYAMKNKHLVKKYIKKYDLEDIKNSHIEDLSGGQKARCAIVRSLASNFDILLLDEVLANLDNKSKEIYKKSFSKLAKQNGKCVIFVSHNLKDIYDISDEVYELKNEKIEKIEQTKHNTLKLQAISKNKKNNIYHIENSFIRLDNEVIFEDNQATISIKTTLK